MAFALPLRPVYLVYLPCYAFALIKIWPAINSALYDVQGPEWMAQSLGKGGLRCVHRSYIAAPFFTLSQ